MANNSLKWVVAKVSYADRIGNDATAELLKGHNNATHTHSASRIATIKPTDLLKKHTTPSLVAETRIQKRSREEDDDESEDEDRISNHIEVPLVNNNPTAQFLAEMEGTVSALDVDQHRKGIMANARSVKGGSEDKTKLVSDGSPAAYDDESNVAEKLYGSSSSSYLHGNGTPLEGHLYSGIDQPVHRPPHVLYAATFSEEGPSEVTKLIEGTSSTVKVGPSDQFSNARLKPELFLCLLYRALQLSKEISNAQIVEMVVQKHNDAATIKTSSLHSTNDKSTPHNNNNVAGSKYLRVFGLFLARFLLAQRGSPELLKQCWDVARTDFRKVRLMGGGAAEDSPFVSSKVSIMRVDEVAFALFTSSRWDRIVLPACKPL